MSSGSSSSYGFLRRMLEFLVDILWRNYYWPDGTMLFLKPGQSLAKKIIKEYEITHLISVGIPFTNHWIARQLKRDDPAIKWLLDIQDVFSYSDEFRVNNFKRYSEKNLKADREVFELADCISITNENARDRYIDLFPWAADKTFVIPPLLIAEDTEYQISRSDPEKKRLAYFGSFYENVRSPEAFLHFLDHMLEDLISNNVKIDIYGEQSPFSLKLFKEFPQLDPILELKGFIRNEELAKHLANYDILLNFGNTTNYHLPSKIVELLYYQKPIVNFITREDDLSKRFLEGEVELLNLNLKEMKASSEAFIQFITRERSSRAFDKSVVERFGAERIAEDYYRLLKD